MSTQLPPHAEVPAGHAAMVHAPTWQSSPPSQRTPQAPQFIGSADVSAHTPAQAISPAGQAHVPFAHTWSPSQETAHAPQWAGSDARSKHAPEQALKPPEHPWLHSPLLQRGADAPQCKPHAPQSSGSLATSTHREPQRRFPAAQAHVPPLQISPASQRCAHEPQWSMLLDGSTHAPRHRASPALHDDAH
jgi:hypothetical protein